MQKSKTIIEYSEDELVAPKWIDTKFLKEVIKNAENNENVKLISHEISPAVTKGNHFGSIMFRVNLTYSISNDYGNNETNTFIIKTMPELDGAKKDLLEQSNVFDTEISMYTETIPYFERELKKCGIDTKLGAEIIYHKLQKPEVIVLEDLKKLEFSCGDGDGWLQISDYQLVLNKLAQWHAASYKINLEGDAKAVQYYKNRSFVHCLDTSKVVFFTEGLKQFEQLLLSSGFDEFKNYIKKFQDFKDNLVSDVTKLLTADINFSKFHVLNHGDCHLRNIMYKKDNIGKIIDVMLVDFQTCVWGSPAIDLVYGLYMTTDPDVRCNKRNEILNYYYNNFVDTLKKLKFNGAMPTFDSLQTEFDKMKKFEIFVFVSFVPFVHQMVRGEKLDAHEVFNDENQLANIFRDPEYIKDVKKTLPFLFK